MMPMFLVLDKSVETSEAFVCNVTRKARLVAWTTESLRLEI